MRIRFGKPFLSSCHCQKLTNLSIFCSYSSAKWIQPKGTATGFSIYNPVTKTIVPFIIKSNDFLSWYMCGPTVYDSAHIGHACTFMRFDIIRRILEKFLDVSVVQVMCITDIDNKIIERARELNTDWTSLTRFYTNEFFDDLNALNIKKPTITAKATDFIPQMIKFIQNLIEKEAAYSTAEGSVYFNVEKYGNCQFKQANIGTYEIPIEKVSLYKRNSSDFALWKGAKPAEPFWESPWGRGRPGWHIECSTIASEYFGHNVDLHSGGIDLMFPHHQNEESQCCVFHNTNQWVNYWLHAGHLHYRNDKMSKSLKNTISIQEYLRTNSPNYLRMLCLYTNYRTLINFDGEEERYSVKMCTKFYEFLDDCRAYIHGGSNKGDIDQIHLLKELQDTKKIVFSSLKNDFDTKTCVISLSNLIGETRTMLNAEEGNRCVTSISLVYSFVESITNLFGLDFSGKQISNLDSEHSAHNINNVIDAFVSFRSKVRELTLTLKKTENDELHRRSDDLFKICDNFREVCKHHGIIIKDRKNDVATWSYVKSVKKKTNDGKK